MSLFTLGTAQWGQAYGISNTTGQPSETEVGKIIDFAASSNISIIDTARTYGLSEKIVGEILKTKSNHTFRIITKLSPKVYEEGASEKETISRVNESVQESLNALQVEKLDTLLLHRGFHRSVLKGLIWKTLSALRDDGIINKIGISAVNPPEAFEAISDPSVEVIQVASSLLDQRLSRSNFFESALKEKREIFIRSVYLQGVAFLNPNHLPHHLKPLNSFLNNIQGLSRELRVNPEEIWLNFARSIPATNLVLGTESVTQVLSNYAVMSKSVSHEVEEFYSQIPQFADELLDPSLWKL